MLVDLGIIARLLLPQAASPPGGQKLGLNVHWRSEASVHLQDLCWQGKCCPQLGMLADWKQVDPHMQIHVSCPVKAHRG